MGNDIRIAKIIETIDDSTKGHKGIYFYCSKRHEYIFIENVKQQTTQYNALK